MAFEMFLDRHGHFFRTRTRHNVAVARRYLRGLAQAEDTVEKLAEGIPPEDWTRCILRDCTRGQLRVDITTRRIWV